MKGKKRCASNEIFHDSHTILWSINMCVEVDHDVKEYGKERDIMCRTEILVSSSIPSFSFLFSTLDLSGEER